MSLKKKGLLTFLAVLLPSFIITYIGIVEIAKRHILKADLKRVSLITDIVKNGLVTLMLEGKGKELTVFLDNIIAEDIEGIYILGKSGNIISSTSSPPLDRNFLNHVMLLSGKANFSEIVHVKINGKDIYSSTIPLYNERPCQRCHGGKDDIRAILHIEVSRLETISKIRNLKYQMAILVSSVFLILIYLFYRFHLQSILKPLLRMTDNIRRQGLTDIQPDMDELQTVMIYINELLSKVKAVTDEIESLKDSNTKFLERLNSTKRTLIDDLQRPLSKIVASMEAFSEENSNGEFKKEILKTFIKELRKLLKTLEDLNR